MLEKLAMLVVERLEPRIDHYIDLKFEALQETLLAGIAEARAGIEFQFASELPAIKKELRSEITEQIVRGVRR